MFLHSSITKVMASGTPFAQVRIQPGTLGEKLSGGVKIMRRQNNYPVAE